MTRAGHPTPNSQPVLSLEEQSAGQADSWKTQSFNGARGFRPIMEHQFQWANKKPHKQAASLSADLAVQLNSSIH